MWKSRTRQDFRSADLKAVLEVALGFRIRRFVRLKCVRAVNFRAEREGDGYSFNVKCIPADKRRAYERLALHLSQVHGGKAVRRVFEDRCPGEFAGYRLICLSWSEGCGLPVDRLSREQLIAFLDDYLGFFNAIQEATDLLDPCPTDRWRKELLLKCQEPWGRLLHPLVEEVPEDLQEGSPGGLKVIHGDFHPGNFSFLDGRLTGIFDLESLTPACATRDLLRYFIFSYERCGWYEWRRRRRVLDWFAVAVRHLRFSRDEWRTGIDVAWLVRLHKKLKGRKVGVCPLLMLWSRIGFYRRMRGIVESALC